MARRVKVDEMDRETYLRTELRAIHARIALCESGELPAHVEAAHRLRAEKTAKLLHELLEARRAAEAEKQRAWARGIATGALREAARGAAKFLAPRRAAGRARARPAARTDCILVSGGLGTV